eukprot:4396726-Pleurochrysis_carterae.AAC.3
MYWLVLSALLADEQSVRVCAGWDDRRRRGRRWRARDHRRALSPRAPHTRRWPPRRARIARIRWAVRSVPAVLRLPGDADRGGVRLFFVDLVLARSFRKTSCVGYHLNHGSPVDVNAQGNDPLWARLSGRSRLQPLLPDVER